MTYQKHNNPKSLSLCTLYGWNYVFLQFFIAKLQKTKALPKLTAVLLDNDNLSYFFACFDWQAKLVQLVERL